MKAIHKGIIHTIFILLLVTVLTARPAYAAQGMLTTVWCSIQSLFGSECVEIVTEPQETTPAPVVPPLYLPLKYSLVLQQPPHR